MSETAIEKPKKTSNWRRWYFSWQDKRDELIQKLGGKCAYCGTRRQLQIDHVDGRNYVLREMSYSRRVRRYLEEFAAGISLQVLCKSCNSSKH